MLRVVALEVLVGGRTRRDKTEEIVSPPWVEEEHGTAKLTKRDMALFRAAFGGFPGGAGSRKLMGLKGDFGVEDVVEVIRELAEICDGWAKENSHLTANLRVLEGQRAAIRTFLGTGGDRG